MEFTAQEIFDKVVNHLRKQNSQSVELNPDGSVKTVSAFNTNPICLYRSADGKKCATGILISDEQYRPEMEGTNIGGVIDEFHLDHLSSHRGLIARLQQTHDFHPPVEWEEYFQNTAKDYNLTYTPLEK